MSSSRRARVLILSFTDVARDPRPLRQIAVLKDEFEVTVASFGECPSPDVEFIQLDRAPERSGLARIPGMFTLLRLLRMHRVHERLDPRNRSALQQLAPGRWDLIVAHDPHSLTVAFALDPARGVVVDLHEFSPEMDVGAAWSLMYRPYYRWLCQTLVPATVAATTVSRGIVDRYRNDYGIEAHLVVNATPFHALEPGLVDGPIRLVHSGVAAPDRRLDTLIAAVHGSAADVTLDLYLVNSFPEYLESLRSIADGDPRIRFHDPVPYRELISTLNRHDVGVHVIAPTSFNNLWALPNKFFDFIQARLGIVVGPSPAMAEIVDRHHLGAVAADFDEQTLRALIESLDRDVVARWKAASNAAAAELAGELQDAIWADVVRDAVA